MKPFESFPCGSCVFILYSENSSQKLAPLCISALLRFFICCCCMSGRSLMGTQPSHILISSQFYQQAPSSTHRLTLQPYSSNQPHPHPLNNDLLIITSGGRKSATPGAVVSICNMAILETYNTHELKISSNHFRLNA